MVRSHTEFGGFPEPPCRNPELAALLLDGLSAIDAECQALYYASPHYSITKHLHAIRQSVAEIVAEIARVARSPDP
jgi:hypothetical protein